MPLNFRPKLMRLQTQFAFGDLTPWDHANDSIKEQAISELAPFFLCVKAGLSAKPFKTSESEIRLQVHFHCRSNGFVA